MKKSIKKLTGIAAASVLAAGLLCGLRRQLFRNGDTGCG